MTATTTIDMTAIDMTAIDMTAIGATTTITTVTAAVVPAPDRVNSQDCIPPWRIPPSPGALAAPMS